MESAWGSRLRRVAHYGWLVLLIGGFLSLVSPFVALFVLPKFVESRYAVPFFITPGWLAAISGWTIFLSLGLIGLAFVFFLFEVIVNLRWFDEYAVPKRSSILILSSILLAAAGCYCSSLVLLLGTYSVLDELVIDNAQYLLVLGPDGEGGSDTSMYVCEPDKECAPSFAFTNFDIFCSDCDPGDYRFQTLDDAVSVVCDSSSDIVFVYAEGTTC